MVLEDAVAFGDARLGVLEKRLGEERPRRPYRRETTARFQFSLPRPKRARH